jgi:hypothetical protein
MSQVGTIDLTMASESNKKRKRSGESAAKPKKKVAIDAPPSSATVSSVLRPKFCPPVIGTNHRHPEIKSSAVLIGPR